MSGLQSIFQTIADTLRARYGADLGRDGFRPAGEHGVITQDFDLRIQQGKGSVVVNATTGLVIIKGYFVITDLSDCSWRFVVTFNEMEVINRSVTNANEPIRFLVCTDQETTVKVSVICDIPQDITLKIRLHAEY